MVVYVRVGGREWKKFAIPMGASMYDLMPCSAQLMNHESISFYNSSFLRLCRLLFLSYLLIFLAVSVILSIPTACYFISIHISLRLIPTKSFLSLGKWFCRLYFKALKYSVHDTCYEKFDYLLICGCDVQTICELTLSHYLRFNVCYIII